MRVFEPWAGLRQAAGHPFFHLAQFVASWIALSTGREEPDPTPEIDRAFFLLQWGHFACFMLYFISDFARRRRALNIDDEENESVIDDKDQGEVLN